MNQHPTYLGQKSFSSKFTAPPPTFRPMSTVVKRSCISSIAEHLST